MMKAKKTKHAKHTTHKKHVNDFKNINQESFKAGMIFILIILICLGGQITINKEILIILLIIIMLGNH